MDQESAVLVSLSGAVPSRLGVGSEKVCVGKVQGARGYMDSTTGLMSSFSKGMHVLLFED